MYFFIWYKITIIPLLVIVPEYVETQLPFLHGSLVYFGDSAFLPRAPSSQQKIPVQGR